MSKRALHFPKNFTKEIFRKDRLLILLLSGILLLVVAWPVKPAKEEGPENVINASFSSGERTLEKYAQYLEQQLEEILSLVEGAGKIRVMITLKDAGEKVVEKDKESSSELVDEEDSEGGSRKTTNSSVKEVSIYDSSEKEGNPYITKEKSPEVEGVLVIAQGGDNAIVVQNITEAVQALFDIDTHKIKIIKGNQ